MFYSDIILAKKGPLGKIWLAAHWDRKISKAQVFQTDITESVDSIVRTSVPLALRVSGHLLLGLVRIYQRKVKYLFSDCSEALVKIKMAFRPGVVDLPLDDRRTSGYNINVATVGEYDMDGGIDSLESLDAIEDDWMQLTQNSRNVSRNSDISLDSTPRKALRSSHHVGGGSSVSGDEEEEMWTAFAPDEEPIATPSSASSGRKSNATDDSIEIEIAREAGRRHSAASALSQDVFKAQESASDNDKNPYDDDDDMFHVDDHYDDDELRAMAAAASTTPKNRDSLGLPDSSNIQSSTPDARKMSFDVNVDLPDEAELMDDESPTKRQRLSSGTDEHVAAATLSKANNSNVPHSDTISNDGNMLPPAPVAVPPKKKKRTVRRKQKHKGPKLVTNTTIPKSVMTKRLKDTSPIVTVRVGFAKRLRVTAIAATLDPSVVEVASLAESNIVHRIGALSNELSEPFRCHTSTDDLPYVAPTDEARLENAMINDSGSYSSVGGGAAGSVYSQVSSTEMAHQEATAVEGEPEDVEIGRRQSHASVTQQEIQRKFVDDDEFEMPTVSNDADEEFVAPIFNEEEYLAQEDSDAIHDSAMKGRPSDINLPEDYDSAGVGSAQRSESANSMFSSSEVDEENTGEIDDEPAEVAEEQVSSDNGDQRKWHQRTVKMMKLLQKHLHDDSEQVVYQDLAKEKKRRTVAGCFFEVLQLKTWGRINVRQDEPYGTIEITRAEKFTDPLPSH